jgi:hypothetical protein
MSAATARVVDPAAEARRLWRVPNETPASRETLTFFRETVRSYHARRNAAALARRAGNVHAQRGEQSALSVGTSRGIPAPPLSPDPSLANHFAFGATTSGGADALLFTPTRSGRRSAAEAALSNSGALALSGRLSITSTSAPRDALSVTPPRASRRRVAEAAASSLSIDALRRNDAMLRHDAKTVSVFEPVDRVRELDRKLQAMTREAVATARSRGRDAVRRSSLASPGLLSLPHDQRRRSLSAQSGRGLLGAVSPLQLASWARHIPLASWEQLTPRTRCLAESAAAADVAMAAREREVAAAGRLPAMPSFVRRRNKPL